MSKIRINELARQLEVKSREVIEKLQEFGIAEKVTHSSSIDDDMAERLRRFYSGEGSAAARKKNSGSSVPEKPDSWYEDDSDAPAAPAARTAGSVAGPVADPDAGRHVAEARGKVISSRASA